MKTCALANGGTLRAVQTDRFKSGILTVTAHIPITKENACFAPLMMSVLRRGTEKFHTLADLNRRLDFLYGTGLSIRTNYVGDRLAVGFAAEILDGKYLPPDAEPIMDGVLELFSQILFSPLLEDGCFLDRYVESEKNLQCDQILSLANRPSRYAKEHFRTVFFEGEPSGIPIYGTAEQIRAVTKESLTEYWRTFLSQFSPDVFYVGPMEAREVAGKLEKTFPRRVSQAKLPDSVRVRRAETVKRAEETLEVSQSHLVIGLRTDSFLGEDRFEAVLLFNEMLGFSPTARLFMTVREKLSLCYSVSSSFLSQKGAIVISCGLSSENRKKAEDEIFTQLQNLQNGGFTDAELQAAKQSLKSGYRQISDSPSSMESFFSGRALAGVLTSPEEALERILSTTREEILAAAQGLTVDTVYFLEGTHQGGDDDEED